MTKITKRLLQKSRAGADRFGAWLTTPGGQAVRWTVTTVLAVAGVAAGCSGK
ncbi:hypothetical protein ACRJ4B_14780 [Streptomyces sp. GTA36]